MSSAEESVDSNELIDAFVTGLRKTGFRCSFTNADTEIKYQVIFGCRSSQLRRYGLQEDDTSLADLIKKGRTYGVSARQSAVIENKGRNAEPTESTQEVHKINKSNKFNVKSRNETPTRRGPGTNTSERRLCYNCGKEWPHAGGATKCPAWNKVCRVCNKRDHFANVCKSKGAVNKIDDYEDNYIRSSDNSSEESYVYSLSKSRDITKFNLIEE